MVPITSNVVTVLVKMVGGLKIIAGAAEAALQLRKVRVERTSNVMPVLVKDGRRPQNSSGCDRSSIATKEGTG